MPFGAGREQRFRGCSWDIPGLGQPQGKATKVPRDHKSLCLWRNTPFPGPQIPSEAPAGVHPTAEAGLSLISRGLQRGFTAEITKTENQKREKKKISIRWGPFALTCY